MAWICRFEENLNRSVICGIEYRVSKRKTKTSITLFCLNLQEEQKQSGGSKHEKGGYKHEREECYKGKYKNKMVQLFKAGLL